MTARAWWVGPLLVVLGGCSAETQIDDDGYTCADPDKSHIGPDGAPDPCHDQAAGAGGDPRCPVGEFVHWSVGWADPMLLWFGPEDHAPNCPGGPMTTAYEGRTDLVAPDVCEPCTCKPPTGSCNLPSNLMASTAVCYAPGASLSFDAPVSWDGLCDKTNQVLSGNDYSLTIDPMTMTESECAPGPTIPAKVLALHWNTFARGCDVAFSASPVERSICYPDDLRPPGFALCIFHEGDLECPTEPGTTFTDRHVFYKGVEDSRTCSACACGAPEGGACTAAISIYTNDTCSGSALDQKTISSKGTTCLDIQIPGQQLRSKSAGAITYLRGTCPAMGGDASGTAVKTRPATICCRS